MEEKKISINYEKEFARISNELNETKIELEKYKKALLNICLKV